MCVHVCESVSVMKDSVSGWRGMGVIEMAFFLMVSHDRNQELVHRDGWVVLCLVWHSAAELFY